MSRPADWDDLVTVGTPNDVTYARGRLPSRIYLSRSFELSFSSSRDYGQRARYATRVFDLYAGEEEAGEEWEWRDMEIYRSPKGRVQVKAMIARQQGAVRQIKIQRVPHGDEAESLESVVTLDRERAQAFIDFIRTLEFVPADSDEGYHLDEQMVREVMRDPSVMSSLYQRDPEQFRAIIQDDATAEDLVALARRREVLAKFRLWLEDDAAFESASEAAGGPERAWQMLFEAEPWILGVGLGGQLLTSWSDARLEQVVGGRTIEESGKHIDALLRTNGTIRSLVLAEIKHHRTELLQGSEHRPGCWGPSRELSGGIVQAQQTAYRASEDLSEFVADRAPDGSDLPYGTFVVRPRTYLIVGSLDQLVAEAGGVHRDKFRSFELHRRNLYEPEVLTFDEVLTRAEWQVSRLGEGSLADDAHVGEFYDPWAADESGQAPSHDPWTEQGGEVNDTPF